MHPWDSRNRILALLREKGGSAYQHGIVEGPALPKSTVSEAVNRLNAAGRIEKVRKGRENLIRLAPGDGTDRPGGPSL